MLKLLNLKRQHWHMLLQIDYSTHFSRIVIDGTYVLTWVPVKDHQRYRCRKGFIVQNVMAAIGFDMLFQFVYVGFEGSANDKKKVLSDVLQNRGIYNMQVPEGALLSVAYPRRKTERKKLANFLARLEEEEPKNQGVVQALYEALSSQDVETVHRLLAPDIEWWFHGPPSHQHMMRLLTGLSSDVPFNFEPSSISVFGSTVVVEGHEPTHDVFWVHAWTVTDGVITQVREYFNTSLTVTCVDKDPSPSISPSPSSSASSFPSLWKSTLIENTDNSMPGLVLAI
ncbi:putative Senescence associated protein 20 [Cinnamomum micranthum f. kanehirae]|uniref:Putative Senescence associated protein 20 n=1 Tax=Cinnamomum micranthum f. kanehirae TaxID=337451 RepID=A0A443NRZ2_9MAGN|nr:putative Senescence associated protein 20 [Cinnamomum micranthum f. kanehirae]